MDNIQQICLIPLTKGKFAIIDQSDYQLVSKYKWYAHKSPRATSFYAHNKGKKLIQMHRLIMGITDRRILIDHKDHDGLNNRRSNLRIVTLAQNAQNSRVSKNTSSKYRGVWWNKEKNKWSVQVNRKHVGHFKTEDEAGLAYNKKATELYGEFASLNFVSV